MAAITHYLSADHNHCDDLFADAENAVASDDWQNGQICFQAFEAATLHHFRREESVLFPAFEASTGMSHGPTEVMRSEHVEMRETLQAMGETIASRNADAYLGLAETLLMLMRQHNMKEEQILYPMADQVLADTAGDMVSQMQALAA
jgi:hemerythrin-like domain-containing protein